MFNKCIATLNEVKFHSHIVSEIRDAVYMIPVLWPIRWINKITVKNPL